MLYQKYSEYYRQVMSYQKGPEYYVTLKGSPILQTIHVIEVVELLCARQLLPRLWHI